MKELVKFIAQSLVDNPEQVQVNEIEGEQTSVIELKVAKEDLLKEWVSKGATCTDTVASLLKRPRGAAAPEA